MALYNKQGQVLNFKSYKEAEEMAKAGQAFFKKSDKITLVDEDYNPITVIGTEATDYLNQGYSLNPVGITAAKEAEKKSALGTFAKSFINEAAFGIPALLNKKDQTELDIETEKAEKAQSPIADTLGAVSGFGTSLFYGGELTGATKLGAMAGRGAENLATKILGEATERNLASRVLARATEGAAKLGVESAAWSAPHAIAEAALGDPESAAEHLASAGLVGGILGASFSPIAPTISKMFKGFGEKAASGELIDPNRAALKALGLTEKEIYKMKDVPKEQIDAVMRKHDLTSLMKKSDAVAAFGEAKDKVGAELGNLVKEADTGLNTAYGNDLFKRTSLLNIDDSLNELEKRYVTPHIDVDGNIEVGFEGSAGKIKKQLDSFRTKTFTTVEDLNNFRKDTVDKLVRNWGQENPMSKNTEFTSFLRDLRSDINEIVRVRVPAEIEAVTGNTGLATKLKNAALEFQTLATVEPLIEKAVIRDIGKRIFSWGDLMHTIAGGQLTGGQAVGAIGGLLYNKAQKLMPKANYLVADVVNGVAKKMSNISSSVSSMLGGNSVANSIPASVSLFTRNDKDEQTQDISKKLYTDIQDPVMMTNIIADKMSGLTELNEAQRAALTNQTLKTVGYLQTIAPKAPQKNPLDNSKWRPSDTEMAKFKRQSEMAINPYKILDYIKSGTVTVDQIEAVSELYPNLMGKIRAEIAKQVAERNEKGKPIPYKAKLNASKVMGMPLDSSMSTVMDLQANFAKPENQEQQNIPRTSKFEVQDTLSTQDKLMLR